MRAIAKHLEHHYDGVLVMLLADRDCNMDSVFELSTDLDRSIIFVNYEADELQNAVRRYVAVQILESNKARYVAKDPTFEKELDYFRKESAATILKLLSVWRNTYDDSTDIIVDSHIHEEIASFKNLSALASSIMNANFGSSLIINNELLNKNSISGSINSAKKNVISGILRGESPQEYYGMQHLSPEYIIVRAALVKNGFIPIEGEAQNVLPDGTRPQVVLSSILGDFVTRAREESIEFGELYERLKQPPFGLRDGYLSLLYAHLLYPHKKALIVSSHNTEQELTVELFEEIAKRPKDYSFTIASWSSDQQDYMDALEQIFKDYIRETMRNKNRLKAIYDAMLCIPSLVFVRA